MAKYTVIVPVRDAKINRGWNEQKELLEEWAANGVENLPFIGHATRTVMTEDELRAWLDMFFADKSLASRFYIERHAR